MAYSAEQWERAKALYELGYSLRDIEEDCGISNGQISKTAKRKGWKKEADKISLKSDIVEFDKKKEALDKEKEAIGSRIASLENYQITVLKSKMEDEGASLARSIIFDTALLAVIRNNEILTRNSKTVMMKTNRFLGEGQREEVYEPYEIELSPSDTKEIIEGTDKASLTLGVNQRHAPKTDINVNATANSATVSYESDYLKHIQDAAIES